MKKTKPDLQDIYDNYLEYPDKAISFIKQKHRLQKRVEDVIKNSRAQSDNTDNVINEFFRQRKKAG